MLPFSIFPHSKCTPWRNYFCTKLICMYYNQYKAVNWRNKDCSSYIIFISGASVLLFSLVPICPTRQIQHEPHCPFHPLINNIISNPKVQVLEQRIAGSERRMLLTQMMRRNILAQVLDIRGFRGRTMAMYLQKQNWKVIFGCSNADHLWQMESQKIK